MRAVLLLLLSFYVFVVVSALLFLCLALFVVARAALLAYVVSLCVRRCLFCFVALCLWWYFVLLRVGICYMMVVCLSERVCVFVLCADDFV